MAVFKYPQYFTQDGGPVFDQAYPPGWIAPLSGIYRCDGCSDEIAANKLQPLPPQNHHQHSLLQGLIRWRLVASAQQIR